jgi:tetratricopeptide (TPR) repeat protein
MWVFWVHASNAARFKQAYREIAAQVELPGRDDSKTDILQAVHNWLCDERNGRWLMVVDNADDDRMFASASGSDDLGGGGSGGGATYAQGAEPAQEAAAPLASFLPQAANGWILVTSRDLVAAVNLVGARHYVIKVEPMSEREALALLKSKMQVDKSSEGNARTLVQTLEGIPLAVTHAAAYISIREPRITISTYLGLFCECEENQTHLLNDIKARDIRRDASVSSAVITTWQLSFEQIRKTRPDAADLLSLMTMFDRQGIPEHVLYEGRTRLQFEEAVAPLTSFSLVRAQAGKRPDQQLGCQLFEMHGLVQLATKKWLEQYDQVDRWEKASLHIMAASFPSGQPETWAACRMLLPHSIKVLGYGTGEDDEAKLDRARIATNTAWYLMLIGQYAEAERHGRSAVIAREMVLGREHPATLTSVSELGLTLWSQGKYKEAEVMHRRALRGRKTVLGQEHPSTFASINNLGLTLESQGKYEEAEAMHRQALRGLGKAFKLEHLDTLTSVSNLGTVLESQGKYEEAEAMHRQALEGCEKVLGQEHPNTLTSASKLATVLWSQGRYREAEAMHRRTLQGRETVLGQEHPSTFASVNNLGLTLESQGKYEEAEAMHRQALEAREKVLGPEHLDTLTSVSNLGTVLESQGKYEEAEVMHRRALQGREKALGQEHPGTLTSVNHLGLALESQGKYEEAEVMHRRALQGREKALGREHPDTLISVGNLGSVLQSQGRLMDAADLEIQAMETRKRVLGDNHPITLTAMANLAFTLKSQGRRQEALSLMEACVRVQDRVLGPSHPNSKSSTATLDKWRLEDPDQGA